MAGLPSLASLVGPPKGGRSGDSEGPSDVNDSASGDDMDAEFQQAAVDAFPDMEGKPERIAALKQAIQACMDSYGDDSAA